MSITLVVIYSSKPENPPKTFQAVYPHLKPRQSLATASIILAAVDWVPARIYFQYGQARSLFGFGFMGASNVLTLTTLALVLSILMLERESAVLDASVELKCVYAAIGLNVTAVLLVVVASVRRFFIPCSGRFPATYKPLVPAARKCGSIDMTNTVDGGDGPLAQLFREQQGDEQRRVRERIGEMWRSQQTGQAEDLWNQQVTTSQPPGLVCSPSTHLSRYMAQRLT